MKRTFAATLIVLASTQLGLAETCNEKFVRLLVGGNDDVPVKIHVVQEIKGGATSTNDFFQITSGHWMTKMIDPANQPWVLTYNNTMCTSSDKGESWTTIRTLDSDQNKENSIRNLKENAETVRNAACREDNLDGVVHDVVEADFNTLQSYPTENHYTYWVNPRSGWISKAIYQTKGDKFESVSTQLIEPMPDLILPTPE